MFHLLLLLGLCTTGICSSRQYHFIKENKTWAEAQRYCRENYVDLASIDNAKEELALINMTDIRNSTKTWIGLYDDLNSWKWSLYDDSFYKDGEKSFRNWYIVKPSNWDGKSLCASMGAYNGVWQAMYCSATLQFICFDGRNGSERYILVNKFMNWTEAQRYCREHHTDLASVRNENCNQTIPFFCYRTMSSTSSRVYYFVTKNCNNYMTFICYDGRNVTEGYIWVNQFMSWAEAQHYCRQRYTDLASVRNQADNKKILNLTGGSSAWIGLYRTRLWSDQHESTYENWRPASPYIPEQPDNGLYVFWEQGNQHCTAVSLGDSGQWTDEDCLATFPFICYNKFYTGSLCTHQYHLVTDNKTWTEAQTYCRVNYTDLATITNMEDIRRLLDTVHGTYSGLAWIGLYDDLNSWKWSLDDDLLYKEEERSFSNWYISKPMNWFGNSLCVYISGFDAVWWEGSCYPMMPFICFDGRRNATERYIVVHQHLSWTDAQRYCKEIYTDLISISNKAENERIRSLLHHYQLYNVWIGLYRTSYWSDKSNSSFSNWNPGQPDNSGQNEHCTAFLSKSGKWTDENCGKTFPFFCYRTSHEYHFVNENKTWTEAQIYCRENYTDLATIDNMEDVNTLLNTVNGSYFDLAWIGLYGDLGSWRWSLDDDTFYKEGERDFRGWYQEPNNYNGKELCVSMRYTGEWFDQQCTQTFGFVCYNGTNNEYVWIYLRKTWQEAQSFCRANHTDLANVRNETDLRKILSVIHGDYWVWIGLYRSRLWSDHSNSTFTYWRPEIQGYYISEPDNGLYFYGQSGSQQCTSMISTGKWTDENCFESFPFLCYSGVVIGLQIKIKVQGNMQDSQVKELVLMQFQQEFIRLGMSKNIKMRVRNIRKIGP
ncbi:macrophage mannose receptor 1-like [Tachysurus ichikawai]